YTAAAAPLQARNTKAQRKEGFRMNRNPALLASRLGQRSGTTSTLPPIHTHWETSDASKPGGTRQTAVNAPGQGFLINRNFAWLAVGQAISNLGDVVYSTTLLIWVFTLTHSAPAVSGVLAAQYLPVFLLGPFAGVFVDRWNRRQTMLISDLIRAVAATLPLIAPASLRLQAIYTSVFLISALGRFF